MNAIRNNIATIVAGVIVAVAVAAAFVLFGPWRFAGSDSLRVIVHDGDGGERALPLSENATLEVTTSLGTNVVVVEDGAARVTYADCPNQSCMKQKPISKPGEQLICLPHHLWVEIVQGENANDTQLDESAVTWNDAQDDAGSNPSDVDVISR